MSQRLPTITYFPLRGRAEVIRLIFEELGERYKEDHVSPEDWDAYKPRTPFGGLPIYQEGEITIPQSLAIYRHIARTRDLCGGSEEERVFCDVACEAFEESVGGVWGALWGTDEDRVSFEREALPQRLQLLERWFTRDEAKPKFWVGDALTLADFFAFRYLDEIDALFPAALEQAPVLLRFQKNFAAQPRIAAYIASGRRQQVLGFAPKGFVLDPRQ